MHHCGLDKGFGGGGPRFIVLAQASILAQPSKGALHHPAPRLRLKALPFHSGAYQLIDAKPFLRFMNVSRCVVPGVHQ